ncbi:MAG: GIY-YIG nuclease family protein [Desulfobacterales bacterium]|nr:GIY-YIG nuclease family protein [Desulfobacterales bacterium]
MTTFTTYIKKQQRRNDPLGDFSRDFVYILRNHPKYPECQGTDTIVSETLFGHYNFLPTYAQQRDYILNALCSLWKEWLEYKHIGLKFDRPKRGYVYFFRLPQKQNVFKIGRTRTDPEKRIASVATRERTNLEIHDWMRIDHYDIIEKELHDAFHSSRLMREWFEVPPAEIDEAIRVYCLTDSTAEVRSILRGEV